jgi:hypothetical protein
MPLEVALDKNSEIPLRTGLPKRNRIPRAAEDLDFVRICYVHTFG